MFPLILITFGVFLLFWLGDLYLTLKSVKHLGKHLEINPFIRLILKGRGRLIYLLKPKNLYNNPSRLYGKKVKLYMTSPIYEIDINTPEDWLMSEIKFKHLQKNH